MSHRWLTLALLAAPGLARATVPDLYGLGARSMGMGGGGVGLVDDGTAAALNPAGLSRIRQPTAGVTFSAAIEHFAPIPSVWWDTNRDGLVDERDPPLDVGADVDDAVGFHFFAGRQVGGKFALGIAGYLPAQRLLRFKTFEPELPTWFMYDNRTQRYTLSAGIGGEPVKGLNVGVGVDFVPAVRLTTLLTADATVTGSAEDADGAIGDIEIDVHEIELDLVPRFAPVVGLQLELGDWAPALRGLVLGATFHGSVGLALRAQVDAQANLHVEDVGDLEPYVAAIVAVADLDLFDHYVPPSVTSSIAWRDSGWFSGYLDVKWTDWRQMKLNVTKVETVDVTSPLVDVDDRFTDGNAFTMTLRPTVGIRAGTELRPKRIELGEHWRYLQVVIRAGGGYEPSPLLTQGASSALLDASRAVMTLGGGVETWDPLHLVDSPVRVDAFGQLHVMATGQLPHSSQQPEPGFARDAEGFPIGGHIVVFGASWGFDF